MVARVIVMMNSKSELMQNTGSALCNVVVVMSLLVLCLDTPTFSNIFQHVFTPLQHFIIILIFA
jgi:hypothetical protein